MGKLIDTDDLKKILLEKSFWPVIVKSALEQIPEAVVRCEECEYYIPTEDLPDVYKNEIGADGFCENTDKYADADGFCNFGKRRSDDG